MSTKKTAQAQPQPQTETPAEQAKTKLTESAHIALCIIVLNSGGKEPQWKEVPNPYATQENLNMLKGMGLLDEKYEPTKKGVAIVLRNTNLGINFSKMVGSLTTGATFKLLFILVERIKNETKQHSIKLKTKEGAENEFWDAVKDASDVLYDILEQEEE